MKPIPFREANENWKQLALLKWAKPVATSISQNPRQLEYGLQLSPSIEKLQVARSEAFCVKLELVPKTSKDCRTDMEIDSQDRARRFNEDEAVWQRYESRRKLRVRRDGELLLPDEVMDELDWIAAERECRLTWCVGRTIQSGEVTTSLVLGFETEFRLSTFSRVASTRRNIFWDCHTSNPER